METCYHVYRVLLACYFDLVLDDLLAALDGLQSVEHHAVRMMLSSPM
jgi:hypothetical protein